MSFELTGKLIEKYETVPINDRFKKREFVIEVVSERSGLEYPDYVKFQLTQNKCSLIDPFNVGDEIKVLFDINGRKWERDGKVSYFTDLRAWKIEPAGSGGTTPPPPPPPPLTGEDNDPFRAGDDTDMPSPPSEEENPEDDLPF